MNYADFLNRVIETGIDGAKQSYADDASRDVAWREVTAFKLEGAIAGFERCREKLPHELLDLLIDAGKNMHRARLEKLPDYWKHACFHAEIEWVCNCRIGNAGERRNDSDHCPDLSGCHAG